VEGSNPGAHQPGGGGEIVVFGAERRPRRPWLGRLLLGGLVIAALVFVVDHPSGQRAEHIAVLGMVNLNTGRTTTMPVPVDESSDSQALAWSPDSRWLFALAANGKLVAIRVSDGTMHSLGVRLPVLSQIAMRATAG